MPQFPLRAHNQGPYIEAPEWCPYQFNETVAGASKPIVHSGLCSLCRVCTFVSRETHFPLEEPTERERLQFDTYLTTTNFKLSTSVAAQFHYLRSVKSRIPLVVLVNTITLRAMLRATCEPARELQLMQYFANQEAVICHILGCPVYYSRKLTQSDIQVVGEVAWRS